MPAGVDHLAAAHPLQVGPPGPGAFAAAELGRHGAGGEAAILHRLDRAEDEGPAQGAGGQQAARLDQARLEELVVGRHEDDAGLVERLADGGGVFQGGAERFLAEDRLAGAGGGEDRLGVEVVGQADVDRVDSASASIVSRSG